MTLKMPWRGWKHVTKLDPDKDNKEEIVNTVLENRTDAILVGGTQGVTLEKVRRLKKTLGDCDVPLLLEPSNAEAVDLSYDYFFVPLVLNSQERWWLGGAHIEWINSLKKILGSYDSIPWDKIVIEAYIILNPESEVARVTKSITNLTIDQIVSHAVYADRIMNAPIVYIEYSGQFGDPNIVKTVKDNLRSSHLFYGGGIDSKDRAAIMGKYATVVVGNIIYDDVNKYKQTII